MNTKKLFYSFFALFFFALLWNAIIHLIILRQSESVLDDIGRRAEERNLILSLFQTAGIIIIFIISYLKWRKQGSFTEALNHGLFFGLLAGLLVDINQYVLYPLPFFLVLYWMIFGVIEFILYGIIMNMIYK